MIRAEDKRDMTKLKFTKMQGAGNDFVVLDATQQPLPFSDAELSSSMRRLGDRRWGVGADQILVVERSTTPGMDFRYRIFNGSTGSEVEQCGNGARCFARYVHDKGLSTHSRIAVETMNTQLWLEVQADGRVKVDMGPPQFEPSCLPFDPTGLTAQYAQNDWPLWLIPNAPGVEPNTLAVGVVSMGNPHAVVRVPHITDVPVQILGPWLEAHPRFAKKVNVGFMEIINRQHIQLRVYERDAGETLACGTGACAAVVAGIRAGWLDPTVDVHTRGGRLTIEWRGLAPEATHVQMTGPAETVFEGEMKW
jgi:diaminopimelate epimerase